MKRLALALGLIGFTAMVAQIVLMRELMVVFYGNELSLGIMLGAWLFWVSAGSLVFGRKIVPRIKRGILFFSLGELLLAFLLPASLLFVRAIPVFSGTTRGEIMALLPIIGFSLIVLAPICIVGGFLFVLGCQIYKERTAAAAQIGRVYVLEAIGASVGGLLAGFALVKLFPPLNIMLGTGFLNIVSAIVLQWKRDRLFAGFGGIVLIALFVWFILGGPQALNRYSLEGLEWKGYNVIHSQNSIYGNITITQENDLKTFFFNGLNAFTVPDQFSAEEKGHFALLEHPNPKKVLLVGGGSGGILAEVLKHPVEAADYVELDPLVITLAKKFLPPQPFDDPRVKIERSDGRRYVKNTNNRYDVIIVNLPGPSTAQLNRFYTVEFFKEAQRILAPGGIFSFSISSNPNYISDEQRTLYISLKEGLKEVFQDVIVTPGQTNHFLGAQEKGILTYDWRILMGRLAERRVDARYMREYYLASELSKERIKYIEKRLTPREKYFKNHDWRPISYYYDMVLWTAEFSDSAKKVFKSVTPQKIYAAFFILCAAVFLIIFAKDALLPRAVLAVVATTGFAEMAFQVVTLILFQIIYGYVYYKLAIILTSYMIGLILGGWLATKRIEKNLYNLDTFIKIQLSIVFYPFTLAVLFWVFSSTKNETANFLGSNVIFPFLPLVAGAIGGFQFPLANKLYLGERQKDAGEIAGITYGLDLFGACVGALVVSIFLLPMIGIYATSFLAAGLNVIGLLLLLKARYS